MTATAAAWLSELIEVVGQVDLRWLAAALLLHYLAQVVRIRGWYNILRCAYPQARFCQRDVVLAYLAGAGVNAVVPARGGDVFKLLILRQRIAGSRYPTLIGSMLPETLFESFCGAALTVWLIVSVGLPLILAVPHLPDLDPAWLAVVAVAAVVVVLVAWRLRDRARSFARQLKQGLVILRRPKLFLGGVVSWQLAGRLIRLGSIACFLAAFSLPSGLTAALLVMAVQSSGTIIPFTVITTPLRIGLLSWLLESMTGEAVSLVQITSYSLGTGMILAVVGVAIATAIIAREIGSASARRLLRHLRRHGAGVPLADPDPAKAPAT